MVPKKVFRLIGLPEKKVRTEDDLIVAFFGELGKKKVRQIEMLAKQKSCRIIDIENRFFVSGASDAQEKSYTPFNI